MGRKNFKKRNNPKDQYRINEGIRAKTVRLVGENIEQGIVSIHDALQKAEEMELDLVEISPDANPPVCKIIDFNKFLYQKRKKQKELKSKQSQVELKELRFTPNTEDHDFNFKLSHAKKFLEDGNKIKAYVFFRGRSIVFKDQGKILLLKFAKALEEYGKVESMPKLEGNRMNLFIAPIKSKK